MTLEYFIWYFIHGSLMLSTLTNSQGVTFDSMKNKILKSQYIFQNITVDFKMICLNQCKNYDGAKCGSVGVIMKTNSEPVTCQFSSVPRIFLLTYSNKYVVDNLGDGAAQVWYPAFYNQIPGWNAYYPLDSITNGDNILSQNVLVDAPDKVKFNTPPVYSCPGSTKMSYLYFGSVQTDYQIMLNDSILLDFSVGFSLSFWFYLNNVQSSTTLIEVFTDLTRTSEISRVWHNAEQGIGRTIAGFDFDFRSSTSDIYPFRDYHVILAVNTTRATLYVNGNSVKELYVSAPAGKRSFGRVVQIGRRNNVPAVSIGQLNGCFGNLAFFQRSVSPAEASMVYNWNILT